MDSIKHCIAGLVIAFVFGAAYVFEERLSDIYKEVKKRNEDLSIIRLNNKDLKTKVDTLEEFWKTIEDKEFVTGKNIIENLSKRVEVVEKSFDDVEKRVQMFGKEVCETGWIPYGEHCYYFSKTTKIFKDAVTTCYGLNSTLVEPNAVAEEGWMLVQGEIRDIKNIWIGVTDLLQNHRFVYISNGNNVQEAYNNWDKTLGQPDPQNNEHCVALATIYKGWHDYSCDLKFHFVCTRRKN